LYAIILQYNNYGLLLDLKGFVTTFLILLSAFSHSLNALETRFDITVNNRLNSNLPINTLISHTHFSKPDFSQSDGLFGVAYKVLEKESGNTIFNDVLVIHSDQNEVSWGDLESSKLTLRYYSQNDLLESYIRMRVTEGTYTVIINGLDSESLKKHIAQ